FDLPLWSRKQGAVAAQQGVRAVVLSQQIQASHLASAQQRLATNRVGDADRLQDLSAPQLLDDAAAALGQIEAGYEGGELDLATALLLRQQVVQGESAVLALTGQVISARLDLLLATEDPALIPALTAGSKP
ncbi:MAG: hypothetical protein GXP62_10830, partial [Oligoflexia bacterium]|nr:hypothetical protein [Oligoflexia bacterium]